MIKTWEYKNFVWHDFLSPDHKEIRDIMENYEIPISAATDLLSPTPKQGVKTFPNCLYLVLHFPSLVNTRHHDYRQEIDFIIGKNFLITVHYEKLQVIEDIFNKANEEVDSSNIVGDLFYRVVKELYKISLSDIEEIRTNLHKVENAIFEGEEKKMVIEISRIHRNIIKFKSALSHHKDTLLNLSEVFSKFSGKGSESFVYDISNEYHRIEKRLLSSKDLLDELRLTNDSLLSAKQNEAIKGLTMMAFVTFPLSLTAAIFTLDTKTKPIIGMNHDFWIIIGIMAAIALFCLAFFSHKKWL